MSARGLKEEWSVAKYTSSIQQDGDSCGVFVFMNAEAILKGMPSSVMRQNHSVEYRRYILGKLISHAHTHNDDVICDLPFCYKPSGDDINWIRCDECSRWFHIGCIGLLKPTDTFTCLYCIV
ncbi:hypothetical protein LSH36_212g03021 [Paralvinella palmiformis]|uniref:Uncharacterized protein n=1 Tax=Paralvinella palmiformis TaxID=53620 RepID=A0AAD9JNI7_9ANNE|nr:hypothetical protein LSH36_212g03021 [Paralvinella palmiformis]